MLTEEQQQLLRAWKVKPYTVRDLARRLRVPVAEVKEFMKSIRESSTKNEPAPTPEQIAERAAILRADSFSAPKYYIVVPKGLK